MIDSNVSIETIDLKITNNNLAIDMDKNKELYLGDMSINLIDETLLGDPSDDIELNLNEGKIKEGFINSDSGTIRINQIDINKLDIRSESGDVYINSKAKIDWLKIKTSNGNVYINDSNINRISVYTSSGDIKIHSNGINSVIVTSVVGDIDVSTNANNVSCKTFGRKKIKKCLNNNCS